MYGLLERQFRRYYEIALQPPRRHRRDPAPAPRDPSRQRRFPPRPRQLAPRRAPDGQSRPHPRQRPQGRHRQLQHEGRRRRSRCETTPSRASSRTRDLDATQIATVPDWLLMDKDNFKGEVMRIPDPRGDRADRQRAADRRVLLPLTNFAVPPVAGPPDSSPTGGAGRDSTGNTSPFWLLVRWSRDGKRGHSGNPAKEENQMPIRLGRFEMPNRLTKDEIRLQGQLRQVRRRAL